MPNMPKKRQALIEARKAAGLTQAQIAQRVGITQQHYSLIENGLRTGAPDVVFRIAAVLGEDPRVLFADILGEPGAVESA